MLSKGDSIDLKNKLSGPLYIPSAVIFCFGGHKAYITK